MGIFDFFKGKAKTPEEIETKPPARRRRVRGYDAAKMDRLTSNWPATNRSADADLYAALATLRGRSRHLAKNDDYAKRFLQMVKTNVIGPRGIALNSQARNDDGSLDGAANRIIENGWRDWGKMGACTIDGKMSFLDCQNLFAETVARDGECLTRMVYPFKGNPFSFALDFIDIDYLDLQINRTLRNGGQVRLGVEYDAAGRVVAYWLKKDHPNAGILSDINYTGGHRRIPADEIIHGYLQNRVRQGRGVPWMAASLRRLHFLSLYEEAELIAATTAASKMGFFIEGEEGGTEDDEEQEHERIMEAEAGTFGSLPYGTEFQSWTPEHPATAFEGFVLSILRGAASGFGVAYPSLANDLRSVSWSSIRQGAIEERDHWRSLQAWMVDHFMVPIFEKWLDVAMMAGALNLPRWKFEKFNAAAWRPRGWQWVDPYKEVNASKIATKNGFKSLTDVAAESGRDIEDVLEQLAQEKKMATGYGLDLESLPLAPGENDDGTKN